MKVLALVLLVAAVYAKHEEYSGWKSYYVTPSSVEELKALAAMAPQYDLDFISRAAVDRRAVVLVKPFFVAGFSKALQESNIKFYVNPKDVKSQLDVDDARMLRMKRKAKDDEDSEDGEDNGENEDNGEDEDNGDNDDNGDNEDSGDNGEGDEDNGNGENSESSESEESSESDESSESAESDEDDESGTLTYDNYQPIEVIDKYLQDIAEKYPEIVTLVTPGNSFEDHPIQYLKISSSNFAGDKPVIFINSGIHAREWIGPPTVTYAIRKLVEDLAEDESDLLEKFDWILLPVVNPDGYKYSANRRFWVKNRSTDQHVMSRTCPGVNLDLNFDFFWNSFGTNNFPCYDNFPGSRAFSEVESRYVRDILLEYENQITLYISMHSYGSNILYPWGNDGSLSGYAFALHTVGISMANAIHAKALDKFKRYTVGNSVLVSGQQSSGSSEDYAHKLGVPLTYDIELPGLDEGLDGFHLPPQYIQQVVDETWAAIVVGARRSRELFWD